PDYSPAATDHARYPPFERRDPCPHPVCAIRHLKDIQAQMRHASVNTTANIYTKPLPESLRQAVKALDRRSRKRGHAKKSRASRSLHLLPQMLGALIAAQSQR